MLRDMSMGRSKSTSAPWDVRPVLGVPQAAAVEVADAVKQEVKSAPYEKEKAEDGEEPEGAGEENSTMRTVLMFTSPWRVSARVRRVWCAGDDS